MLFHKDSVALSQIDDVAKSIANIAIGGDVFVLIGDLGAGKTTLVKAIAKELGVTAEVTSPTFAIVANYKVVDTGSDQDDVIENLVHVDTYRLNHVNELYDLGIETIFDSGSLTFIEWGDRVVEFLDSKYFEIEIDDSEVDSRSFIFRKVGEMTFERISKINTEFQNAGWAK